MSSDDAAAPAEAAGDEALRRPAISYPEELPVSRRKDDIAAAIRDNQVVIVAGDTGSGKTTQLPKICLEIGRGTDGMIGHTQPRRLAARSVADRIAEELGTVTGAAVGYKMRFTDRVGDDTLVKLMTDGILLAELAGDKALRQYDTLIIDEAHERSLNIDFILGYLKQLLPRRPDLKVIITSATIDPERFAEHFGGTPNNQHSGGTPNNQHSGGTPNNQHSGGTPNNQHSGGTPNNQHSGGTPNNQHSGGTPNNQHGGGAPIIEVSGRTYPVETRYRPFGPDDDRDQTQAIVDAVGELSREGTGDVLVFLSGEREIRDTADALRAHFNRQGARGEQAEILPLYARLSASEQHRIFHRSDTRRIVLATNIAETSLTVPGIRYVVDTGLARISRYSQRLGVQRLPIEPISQASANQRKGRCGRTSDGICIRLYSEDDFEARPEFTDPEIVRTNLASVILQMAALGLGDLAAFPFLDPPDRRYIRDGIRLLHELRALNDRERLTKTGRKLARLPVDPRLGRMVLEAERTGCLREVLVIAAALSIQDPRERPAEHEQAARAKHARFNHEDSDFLAYLNLWEYVQAKQRDLSGNQFRKLCRAEFLHYLRLREWQDVHAQLRQAVKSVGGTRNTKPAGEDRIHMALLSGLLSHAGMLTEPKRRAAGPKGRRPLDEYLGARGTKFAIFPGSALAKSRPQWVMAAELVETSRLWARVVAKIDPAWLESLGGHLVKRHYSEPHWEKKRGAVMAVERVTLFGMPIVTDRRVSYGKIDPEVSRELFIRHALVDGEWDTRHEFFHANRDLLESVEDLENRARRRDLLVSDDDLFAFYDERIGAEVVSAAHFDTWWKEVRRTQPDLLTFDPAMVVRDDAAEVSASDYPDVWADGELELALSYEFDPGATADGVTVHIPVDVLNQVGSGGFDWLVPGMRHDLVVALIRSLPKSLRRNFVPVPDYASDVLNRVGPEDGPLLLTLERELGRMAGVTVPREAWDLGRIPDHLRMTFRAEDSRGRVAGEGKDLDALKRELAPATKRVIASVSKEIEQDGLTSWSFGELPRTIEGSRDGRVLKGFPALVDEGESVAVRVLESEAEQRRAMWPGTRRLLQLTIPSPNAFIAGTLTNESKLALSANPHGGVPALLADCVACAVDKLMADAGGVVWDEPGFASLRDAVRIGLVDVTLDVLAKVEQILTGARSVSEQLTATRSLPLVAALTDIRAQLDELVYAGFVTATGWSRLGDVVRYVRAMQRRLEKVPTNHNRDRQLMDQVYELRAEYDDMVSRLAPARRADDDVVHVRWMLEELRVSYFAQSLGTAYAVSDKRVLRAIDALAE